MRGIIRHLGFLLEHKEKNRLGTERVLCQKNILRSFET